jgi:hypothetical protein
MKRTKKQKVFSLPVSLPVGFCDIIGYHGRQSMYAVFWFHAAQCAILFDGVSFKRAKDEPFVALCLEEKVIELAERHKMKLWGCTTSPTHWLLIDGDDAWLATPDVARWCVTQQKFPNEAESEQLRLPL